MAVEWKSSREGWARSGSLRSKNGSILTPALFPVVSFIGGTTVNCGGLWKYLRTEIFRRHVPILSEATHFTNFRISSRSLTRWRDNTFHEWYPAFKAPLFLDSGGFQLMNNKALEFEKYGLTVDPKAILGLQTDFGADIIATLDYPLPPNLNDTEAQERSAMTISNAVTTLKLLQSKGDDQTRVLLPVHGRTPAEVSAFVQAMISRIRRARTQRAFDGFAIGSLVPIRSNPALVVSLLIAAKRAIADAGYPHLPVHVFGVGSTLIPYLAYLGIDTFDSSTYVQNARNLQYTDPVSWKNQRVTRLKELTCSCRVCKELDLRELQGTLSSYASFQTVVGRYKSEFYSAIAAHNLELHLDALDQTRNALEANELEDFLIQFTESKIRKEDTLNVLANEFDNFRIRMGRRTFTPVMPVVDRSLSLKFKPSDFEIPISYSIPDEQRILVLFPCSKEKPYTTSKTFKSIKNGLTSRLNGLSSSLHFVVVSGLYGPVPIEFDNLAETKNYDFVLSYKNLKGIEAVGKRVAKYIAEHEGSFDRIVAIAPSKPYRKAIALGLKNSPNARVFPTIKRGEPLSRAAQQQRAIDECSAYLNQSPV